MSGDMLEVSSLLRSGIIAPHEVGDCLRMFRAPAVAPSSLSSSLSLSSLSSLSSTQDAPSPPADEEVKLVRGVPAPPLRPPQAFQQSTLWDHGASVKRKLPDGSSFTTHTADGLPQPAQPRSAVVCRWCRRVCPNAGGLANHIRWSHADDEATLRTVTKTTSSSTRSSSTSTVTSATSSSTTTSSSSSSSSTITVIPDDGDQPPKKRTKRRGATTRCRYSYKTKWVRVVVLSLFLARVI
jgi:NAD-dependent dihydropyrimidine dehydrogenase PreA subunit